MRERWVRSRPAKILGASVAALAGWAATGKLREADLAGEVVLITGGSRGLGFLLAREFGRQGCKVVICARDADELARARQDLEARGISTHAVTADVSDPEQVVRLVEEADRHFGKVDILVNNAGIIQSGPLTSMTLPDFREAMEIMYWGTVYPTLSVLPQMRARDRGRIVNITSIGGKLSVPHLLPYSGAKFAAVGFSEGLRAELSGTGIRVTTIVPGLMRTGSYLNAFFKGRQQQEFSWFSLGSSLPFISMDAERAARQIVTATRRGEAERTLSLPAAVATRMHGIAPGPMSDLLGLAGRWLLPDPDGRAKTRARGMEVDAATRADSDVLAALTTLGRRSGERFHQFPGPDVSDAASPSTDQPA